MPRANSHPARLAPCQFYSVASPLENLSGPGRPLQKEAPDAKEFAEMPSR